MLQSIKVGSNDLLWTRFGAASLLSLRLQDHMESRAWSS
jgi:hypothetical protein